MQIIIPLHNENLNNVIDKNEIITISTNEIENLYDGTFYAEIAKLFYTADKKLLTDKICGFMQNRRILKDFYKFEMLLKENDIIVPTEEGYHNRTILEHFEKSHKEIANIFKKSLTTDELNYLQSNKKGSYHNIFITSNEIFYDYVKYLQSKLIPIYNECKQNNFSNKKHGAWMAERFLILYRFNRNLKSYQLPMTVYNKNSFNF